MTSNHATALTPLKFGVSTDVCAMALHSETTPGDPSNPKRSDYGWPFHGCYRQCRLWPRGTAVGTWRQRGGCSFHRHLPDFIVATEPTTSRLLWAGWREFTAHIKSRPALGIFRAAA